VVKTGDVLPANREVATLLLSQHLWFRVYVPETWLGHSELGESVKVRVDSFPNRILKERSNKLIARRISPAQCPDCRGTHQAGFGIKVRLKNDNEELRPGMSADVTFPKCPK